MTKQELQAQASELQKQLEELSKKIDNCKEEPRMFPQKGEEYWSYDVMGAIFTNKPLDSAGRLNAYRTEVEAINARDIQWAKQRVAHKIAVLNDGWTPDWDNVKERKYMFYFCSEYYVSIDSYTYTKKQPNWMYCKTRAIAEQVIKECREDLTLIFSE